MRTILHTLHGTSLQAIDNPIGGMTPSFSFGESFDSWWKKVIAGVWGLCLIWAVAGLMHAGASIKSSGDDFQQRSDGKKEMKKAIIGLGIVAGVSPIVAGILFVAG